MKLLVIVLSLLSERFLIHTVSQHRFYWFNAYFTAIKQWLGKPKASLRATSWFLLALVVLPVLLITCLVFYLTAGMLFGFIRLLLNLVIFYYCLGPGNPFYPVRTNRDEAMDEPVVGDYLAQVNSQLFAVIFWYIVLGPVGALAYRLIWLCQHQPQVSQPATALTALLEWIPARITALLYLLVGNFQLGFSHFIHLFFSSPVDNQTLLKICGLQAVRTAENESAALPAAESLVEHAVIVFLVLLAFFTLVAWL